MKKIIALLMAVVMLLSLVTFVGCKDKNEPVAPEAPAPEALKLGLGVITVVSATDANADVAGQGKATLTAAAVLVNAEGKIVKAFIDCADNAVSYKADGTTVANASFLTKYEKGDAYGMVAYGHAAKEWYAQADAFCALIVGKTANEVKALVAGDNKGTDEVLNAGCTIYVAEFALAIEKAINNATATNATANDTIKLGVATTQETVDANGDTPGYNKLETYFFAAAVNAEGKVVAASSDCVEVKFTFDKEGKSTFDATKAVLSKKEKGDAYGMVAYGGAAKEWYAQAAAFDAACIGKTASEINGLMGADYKGNADVQAAGCTIYVSGFIKAATKIG